MPLSLDAPFDARAADLAARGLYDPKTEHDACGVGLIAAIDGKPRRQVVEMGIAALKAVWHRGAVGGDGKTGDGAGLHVQIPHAFFEEQVARAGHTVPPEGLNARNFALAMLFLPRKNLRWQEACRIIIEQEMLHFGHRILGWRQVPVNAAIIGDIAGDSRPEIEQLMIQTRGDLEPADLERELYRIRRRIEKAASAQHILHFYMPSLSCRSVVYKGLFRAEQLTDFYPDLLDARFTSNYALFHQRFSTNTAPAWALAQPFRVLAHNGEINTIRGNEQWMKSHETTMRPRVPVLDSDEALADLIPVLPENTSDTGELDAACELLTRAGHSLPISKLILIPPAWANSPETPENQRPMFAYTNALCEPWDGPAAIAACDGEWVLAGMDRGGLRPMRYSITKDNLLLIGSESGMVPVKDADVVEKGRLGPGDLLGVHLDTGTLYRDRALKDFLAAQKPYGDWVENIVELESLEAKPSSSSLDQAVLRRHQLAAGYTHEDIETILHPMAATGKEAIGSMGDDTPLAMLSRRSRGFHHFFRQNFSQVTNPPIDSLREHRVMSLRTRFGNRGNILADGPEHGDILLLDSPVLLDSELATLSRHFQGRIAVLSTCLAEEESLREGLDRLTSSAEALVRSGQHYLILSDADMGEQRCPMPMILAVSAVHTHLVKAGLRKVSSIVARSAECGDVHHLAVLVGVGATAVNPWLAEATVHERAARGLFPAGTNPAAKLKEALSQGLLKVMSKMGISVISSYRGGYNFEALGLSRALVAEFFPGLSSRLSGIGLNGIERRARERHREAWTYPDATPLPVGGYYKYRAGGETHAFDGPLIHLLQSAVTQDSYKLYKQYSEGVRALPTVSLRDLLDFASDRPAVDIAEVESITEIRRRFVAPAMSLGALSPEAHETLTIAMNRIGASSNSGEGGEGADRFRPRPNGDNACTSIKQVASARFGVTAEYLNAAREIQIKVAQGAKPGEGGQLPGFKVTMEIARLRHATPGVTLISPPPHHDIYSIEDLAQLIYDLKQINPTALVSVKLVAQSGVGTIASGVAKAMADKILISGHTGGTGASPYSSVKHAGIPWEMGLAEANQVLTLNRMRHKVTLQTDGGLKTGRDIVIAALLGAEEYGVGTASLVAMGCILVRQCQSNTCPVGICTQDPALRAKFEGSVDKVISLMSFVAEEVREILAALGYRKLEEVVGRVDLLRQVDRGAADLVDLDLNPVLALPDPGPFPRHGSGLRNEVPESLDAVMIHDAKAALEHGERIQLSYTVHNTHRAVGTRLSGEMVRRELAVPQEGSSLITVRLRGSAGQSLGAFGTRGLRLEVLGDANDYVGKGLSGATIVVKPRASSPLVSHLNTIIGNTVLYGATSGRLFAAGQAGERFCVRNSGAEAVAEGCGAHGCEYMTGGTAVLLGAVGDNFGAGMTGGMAFVYDPEETLPIRINPESVLHLRLASTHWESVLRALVQAHADETGSAHAVRLLHEWEWERARFWQICPREMVDRLEQPLVDEAEHTDKKHRS